jgi:NAD(P)-dependent dehydrogenase (short-subunit alcohol dehydrogenase family)
MKGLEGKVAMVTGGGSGLGEAIAKALARHGTRVVLSDINLPAVERVVSEITDAGGTASAMHQDTARPEDSEQIVHHAVTTFGALHYAVNNAGIGGTRPRPAKRTSRTGSASSMSISAGCSTACGFRSRRC